MLYAGSTVDHRCDFDLNPDSHTRDLAHAFVQGATNTFEQEA